MKQTYLLISLLGTLHIAYASPVVPLPTFVPPSTVGHKPDSSPKKLKAVKVEPLEVIKPAPSSFAQQFDLGNKHFNKKEYEQAVQCYKKALEYTPNAPQALFNLGISLANLKQFKKAIEPFEKALEQNPAYTKAHLYLAEALRQAEDYEKAVHHYRCTVKYEPRNFLAYLGLGKALCELDLLTESIVALRTAHALKPDDANIALTLANTLSMNHQTEQALNIYRAMLAKNENDLRTTHNMAYALKKIGKVKEAIPLYQKILAQNPNNIEANFGLGLSYLMMGEFEQGFVQYEWRASRHTPVPAKNSAELSQKQCSAPTWDGSDLTGKTIVLYGEQGIGDTFQFIRYAQIAKEKGGTVFVVDQNPTLSLLSQCPYIDKVFPLQSKLPDFDVQASLLSMPYIVKSKIDTIPNSLPYLFAQPELCSLWKNNVAHDPGIKVGICWQGNMNYPTHFFRKAVAGRTISLDMLAPLSHVQGVTLYSLQKTKGTDLLDGLPEDFRLVTFGDDFDNEHGRFMDTAALIKNLDLVITIDTSIAHLAGGLGANVWLLLPTPADWRWMLDRNDTPWYPNMRVFRQPTPGNWDAVMQDVLENLLEFTSLKRLEKH